MSIPTNTGNASVTYEGNGSSVLFTIPFTFSVASEIAVYLNGTPAGGVTVYDAGNPFGGTVTFAAAPAPGDIIHIRRLQTVHVSGNDTTAESLVQKLVAGSNITLTEQNDGGNETLEISAIASPDPADVKVSSNDSTAGFLNGKLVAGDNVTLTEQNDGENETLEISVVVPPDPADVKVSSNDSTAGFLNGKLVAGSNVTLTEQNDGENEALEISAVVPPDLADVKVSSNDSTAGFLNGKLVAGSNITLTEQNDGGNETLQITAVVPPDPADVKVSSNDTTAGFLGGKLVAGSGIMLTEQNDGSNETLQISVIGGAIPSGLVSPFGGNFAPGGWLLCDGAAVSRTTYASLFTAISTMYGPGNGTTTFNLPDLRGRVAAGKDNMGGTAANRLQVSTTINTTNASASATVANVTGLTRGMTVHAANVPAGTTITAISGTTLTLSANATATATGTAARFSSVTDAELPGGSGGYQQHQLTEGELARHRHYTGGDQVHTVSDTTAVLYSGTGPYATAYTGNDQPHNNVQPTLILNYIIKA